MRGLRPVALAVAVAGCAGRQPAPATAPRVEEPPPPTREEAGPIFAALAGRANELQHCYDVARVARPDLEGALKLRLVVGADGATKRAEVAAATIEGDEVPACVLGILRALRFPARPTGRDVRLGYTIGFEQ